MKLNFVIHDINKTGGQERSTLEIIKNLSPRNEISICASTHADVPSAVKTVTVPVLFRRPLVIKDFLFRLFSSFYIPAKTKGSLYHATGTCVFFADVFTIQFIQRRWNQELHKVKHVSFLKGIKERMQVWHDCLWEILIFSLNKNRRFIAISEQVGHDLKNLYGLKDIVVIPHGVNTKDFFPEPLKSKEVINDRHPELKNNLVFLFVGAFERKGLRTLIEALEKISTDSKAKNVDWKLVVVGSGPISEMQRLAKKLGLYEKILFVGSRNDVSLYYQAADLFILPSHYDPFGLVGAEALASGCPSILSRSSGCSSIIKHGENGFILEDSSDVQALANLILQFLDKKSLHAEMRSQARSSVESFNWVEISLKYETTFKEVLENNL